MPQDEDKIEESKMIPHYQFFYIESLLTITRSATREFEYLSKVLQDQELFDENPDVLIDLAENIINQAATLSRFLWPTKMRSIHVSRGEFLREKLLINDDNILKNRSVRNYLEHFDEYLDVFLNNTIAGSYFPKRVVNTSDELDEVTFVFRSYIIREATFRTLEREVCIHPIMEEIYRIHNMLVEFSQNGYRFL